MIITRVRHGESLDEVARAVEEEVARLGDEGPTDEEVERAVARLTHEWMSHVGSAMGRADALNHYETLHGDAAMVDGVLDRLAAVTPEAVCDVTGRLLVPANRAVVEYRLEDVR